MTTEASDINERYERLEALRTEILELAEVEQPTDEQATRWDEANAEFDALRAELDAYEARQARVEQVRAAASRPGGREDGDGARGPELIQRVEPTEIDMRTASPMQLRDAALKVVEQEEVQLRTAAWVQSSHSGQKVSESEVGDKLDRLIRTRTRNLDGTQIARRLLLTERDAYRSAWVKALTQNPPAFTTEESEALAEYRAMSIGTDSAGGYGVPVLIDPSIILTAQGSLNPFRRISRVETITTDEWKGVSSAGVTWSYDAEAAEVSDDSPTLAQPNVVVHAARGFIPYSIEVGQDYPGFAEEMSRLLVSGYDELQAQAFCTGSGTGQPFGILTALDANTNVEVVVTTDGTFSGHDINKVWTALPDRYKPNATWVMSHDVGAEVATFGNGNNLSFVTVDLTGIISTIRTRPVEFASHFPEFTGTTSAANILVVGDFRNYLIAERAGMTVEQIPHLFHTSNNRPSGQRGWFAWARHGADSVNDLGFRLLQNQ